MLSDKLPFLFTSLILCSCLLLAGCGEFTPVYQEKQAGENLESHNVLSFKLSNLQLIEPETRTDQLLRNELLFRLKTRDDASGPVLSLSSTAYEKSVNIQAVSKLPSAKRLLLKTSIKLQDSDLSLSETLSTTASYNISSQQFAAIRAKKDAEERAAKMMASLIHNKLINFYAQHK